MGLLQKRGRVLVYKPGFNPNSSSIGTNLAPLLYAGTILAFLVPAVSFAVGYRLRRRKKAAQAAEPPSE